MVKFKRTIAIAFMLAFAVVILVADNAQGMHLFAFVKYIPGRDWTGHFFLFGFLAAAFNYALYFRRVSILARAIPVGSLIALAIAIGDEFSQLWIQSRTFDLTDLLFDVTGIVTVTVCSTQWMARPGSVVKIDRTHE